jgi:DNA-binding beta-propeller fold protein YncE
LNTRRMNQHKVITSDPLTIICALTFVAALVIFSCINIIPVEAKYVYSKKWGTYGTGNAQFNEPQALIMSPSGEMYVADTGNHRIQMFKLSNPCPNGTTQITPAVCFVSTWGVYGTANAQFKAPKDVALDSSGRVYVADYGNKRIQMFKSNGQFMKSWNNDGPGTVQFGSIVGVAVDTSTNDIYVADLGQNSIHKFRLDNSCPSGTTKVIAGICFVTKWKTHVFPPGPPIEHPSGIAVNSNTHVVYVPDSDRNLVQAYTSNGNPIFEWGSWVPGSGDGDFDSPHGIFVDSLGYVYVADSRNNRIQVFTGTDTLVTKWGSQGTSNGLFQNPYDVMVGGPQRHVFVIEAGNNRIQEFFWKTDVGGPGGGTNIPH